MLVPALAFGQLGTLLPEPTPPPLPELSDELPVNPPAQEEPSPIPLEPQDQHRAQPPTAKKVPRAMKLISAPANPTRLFVELSGGLAGGASGLMVGVGLGCAADIIVTAARASGCGPATALIGVLLTLTGIPLGTYLAGEGMGLQGSLPGAIVGMFTGLLLAIPSTLLTLAVFASSGTGGGSGGVGTVVGITGIVITALLPFLGAVGGYELSRGRAERSADEDDRRLSVTPVLGVARDRALAGMTLTF